MNLVDVFKSVLKEQEETPLEYPRENIVISKFPNQKKIQLAPLDKTKPAHKIRSIINQVEQKFPVKSSKKLDHGVFEITLDPVSDFLSISDFIDKSVIR